jgi:arsenate reductase-like glutaredoxin family protein
MPDDGSPISSDKLKQVLDRLNDVLAEAARLRKEVMRQLGQQKASQQQVLSSGSRRRGGTSRRTKSR